MGTLAAIPLYLLLRPLGSTAYLLVLTALFALGVWLCGKASRELGDADPGAIVWDEIVGYLAAMTGSGGDAWAVLAGLLLFRIFDIWKPWPIRWVERRVAGGLGIMLDDLLAAVYTSLMLHALAALARA